MQPNWASLGGLQNQPRITSAITMDNLYTRPMDSNGFFNGAVASGYMRPNVNHHASPTVLSNSSPYSHQTLEYPFHPPFPVGAPQTIDPVQFPNVALASSFPIHPFQQQGSASHSLSMPPSSVPYGQPISYLPQPAVMMPNGGINQVHQIPTQQPTNVALKTRFDEPLEYFYSMMPSQRRRNKPKITSKTNLYIIGLDDSDNDETLRSLVDGVVQPKSCKAMMDKGKCTGAGFIDCASESDAECARLHIINKSNRPKLSVKYADENEKDIFNVYVRNLPRLSFTEEKFKALFREYGPITSVKLIDTKDGSTVIGFVRFERSEDAERAIEEMNKSKSTLPGCNRPITCKLADKAEPRRRIPNVNNTGGLNMHSAENKVVGLPQAQVLRNHLSRNSNPSQPLNHSQTQHQSLYSHQHPLATLLQSFQQAHIAVANIQPSQVTAHTRAVLVPSVIPNGASGPAVMAPISFTSVGMNPQNNANAAVPYPLGFASQQLARLPRHLFVPATAYVAPSQLDNSQRSKTNPNVPSGSYANSAPIAYSTQSAQNNFQSLTHGTPITSNFQASMPFAHQHTSAPVSNAPNSQMMLVTLPSANCLYQQTRSSSASSHAFTTITNVHDYISTLNSSNPSNDSKPIFSNQTSECLIQSAQNNTAYPVVDLATSDSNFMAFPSSGMDSVCPPVVSSAEASDWKTHDKLPSVVENPMTMKSDEKNNSFSDSSITDKQNAHTVIVSDNNGMQNHESVSNEDCADQQEFKTSDILYASNPNCPKSGASNTGEQCTQSMENLNTQDSSVCVSEPNSTANQNIPLEFNDATNSDQKTDVSSEKYNTSVGKGESPSGLSQH